MKITDTPLKYILLLLLTAFSGVWTDFSAFGIRKSSEEVLRSGARAVGEADSIMYALVNLVNSYSPKMSKEDKIQIIDAHEKLANYYLSNYFNYSKAGDHLRRALQLCDETNHDKSQLYMSMALLMHSLIDSSDLPDLIPQTKRYYILAIEEARKHNNTHIAVMTLVNLVELARLTGSLPEIAPQVEIVKKMEELPSASQTDKQIFQHASIHYEASLAMANGDYSKGIALLTLRLSKAHLPDVNVTRRRALILLLRGCAYWEKGDLVRAKKDLNEVITIADTANLSDLNMSALRHLADIHIESGEKEKAVELRMRYLTLRDSVINYQQLASIKELQVMERMYEIDKEMSIVKQRNQYAVIIIILILIVTVAVSWAWYTVRKKKQTIIHAYESLYHNNIKLLAEEESHRHKREAWEAERKEWEAERMNRQTESAQSDGGESDNIRKTEIGEPHKPAKYQNSLLDENTKDDLMIRMEDILSKEEIVCDLNFSSDRLAQMVGVPYKYLSQVINERYKTNFSSFINEYRIKAACRIMQTEKGHGMTIEGIANMVGFKSRSAFGKIFKSITGLSPSDFMNLSKKEGRYSNS